jgi:subtilisin family serine protease
MATESTQRYGYRLEPELVVVANREADLRATREGLASAEEANVDPLNQLLREARAEIEPLFGESEERLRRAAAQPTATGEDAPDLSVFYRVDARGDLESVAQALLDSDAVEAAYVVPPAEPAEVMDGEVLNLMTPAAEDAPPASPDFTSRQGYLNRAPDGIDARHAWTVTGGRGTGVNIIDIEGAWQFTHEDLRKNQGGVVSGVQIPDVDWRNHGTAVIGEFGGDRNAFGVVGIAPAARVRAASILDAQGRASSARAIREAADALDAGDIILIELHRPGPRATGQGQFGFIAIEWWEQDFAAIRYATSRGIIVVEAAGNGSQNLDDPIYSQRPAGFPQSWRNPFNRANRDSRAVVVGAGAPPPGTHGRNHGPDRSRLDFSNWGAMVDAQGWGREVTTTGYGDLQGGPNEDLWYTDQFSGTSSASPIVVGAIACLQGVAQAHSRPLLKPLGARKILRNTGSPQQDAPGRPASQRIGRRPDLRAAISRLMTPSEDGELAGREDLLVEHALEQRVAQLELEVAELRALSGAEAST